MDAWSPNDEGYPFGDVAVATMTATTVYRQGLPRQHAARVTSPAGGQFTARLDVGTVSWAEPDVWAFPEKHGLYRYYCPGHNGGVCQYGMCDETRVQDLDALQAAASRFETRWVCDEVRKLAAPDEYGRTMPFAVYVQYERGEVRTRNLDIAAAEKMADEYAAEGRKVHVSLDTCG
jgi:hypothetical protein